MCFCAGRGVNLLPRNMTRLVAVPLKLFLIVTIMSDTGMMKEFVPVTEPVVCALPHVFNKDTSKQALGNLVVLVLLSEEASLTENIRK